MNRLLLCAALCALMCLICSVAIGQTAGDNKAKSGAAKSKPTGGDAKQPQNASAEKPAEGDQNASGAAPAGSVNDLDSPTVPETRKFGFVFTNDENGLILMLMIFTVIILIIQRISLPAQFTMSDVTRFYSITMIVFGGLVLVVSGVTDSYTAPAFGLLGTVAGYVLRGSASAQLPAPVSPTGGTPPPDGGPSGGQAPAPTGPQLSSTLTPSSTTGGVTASAIPPTPVPGVTPASANLGATAEAEVEGETG